ncbi:MAG: hypothetical protein JSR69_21535 [Proteobacteria bacterium]|nr:hypothetical protein [Pseudomonadota bacterium]
MASILELAQSIEGTRIGVAIAESALAFPIIEGIHLIGLSISVGLIFLTDLRLLGLFLRHVPLNDVLHHLRPYVLGGFAAIFISGGLLFWAEAATLVASPPFPFKLAFIVLGGLNALYFEFVIARQPAVQNAQHGALPANAQLAGLASLVLWTLVIICGRLIPYIPAW